MKRMEISNEMKNQYLELQNKAIIELTEYFNLMASDSKFLVSRLDIGYKSVHVEITYNNQFGASISIGKTESWGEDVPKWYLDGVGGVGRRDDVEADAVCKMYILQGEVVKNWKAVIMVIEDTTSEMYDMRQEWNK